MSTVLSNWRTASRVFAGNTPKTAGAPPITRTLSRKGRDVRRDTIEKERHVILEKDFFGEGSQKY
jgi:hypothetical protein